MSTSTACVGPVQVNNSEDDGTNDIWNALKLSTGELIFPNLYECMDTEHSCITALKVIPLATQLVISKFALINENFIQKFQPTESLGTSVGYIHSDVIFKKLADEQRPVWHGSEKRFIAHSNSAVQTHFIVGSILGLVAEGMREFHIGLALPKLIGSALGTSSAAVLGTTITAGLISVAILQWSLVGYTALQLIRANRKCTKTGLLKDRVEKLELIYTKLHKLNHIPADQIKEINNHKNKIADFEKIAKKLEDDIVAISVMMEHGKLRIINAKIKKLTDELKVKESREKIITLTRLEEKAEKLKREQAMVNNKIAHIVMPIVNHPYPSKGKIQENNVPPDDEPWNEFESYKVRVNNLIAKKEKQSSTLALQLGGWINIAVAATLLVVATIVVLPAFIPLIPIAAACVAVGLVFHIVAHYLNRMNKMDEFKNKKDNFYQALEKIKDDDDVRDRFINILQQHLLTTNDPDKPQLPKFKFQDLESVKNDVVLGACLNEHKSVLPSNLRKGIAVLACIKKLELCRDAVMQPMITKLIAAIKTKYDNEDVSQATFWGSFTAFFNPVAKPEEMQWFGIIPRGSNMELKKIIDEYSEIMPPAFVDAFKTKTKTCHVAASGWGIYVPSP